MEPLHPRGGLPAPSGPQSLDSSHPPPLAFTSAAELRPPAQPRTQILTETRTRERARPHHTVARPPFNSCLSQPHPIVWSSRLGRGKARLPESSRSETTVIQIKPVSPLSPLPQTSPTCSPVSRQKPSLEMWLSAPLFSPLSSPLFSLEPPDKLTPGACAP